MSTASTSKKPSKRSKKASADETTERGRRLLAGLKQLEAHLRGEITLPTYVVPGPVDVRAVRQSLGHSQSEFARRFALSTRTLQEWEQGRSEPDSVARAYLTVIARNPQAVEDALWADTLFDASGKRK